MKSSNIGEPAILNLEVSVEQLEVPLEFVRSENCNRIFIALRLEDQDSGIGVIHEVRHPSLEGIKVCEDRVPPGLHAKILSGHVVRDSEGEYLLQRHRLEHHVVFSATLSALSSGLGRLERSPTAVVAAAFEWYCVLVGTLLGRVRMSYCVMYATASCIPVM
jgi:hypothetical protein